VLFPVAKPTTIIIEAHMHAEEADVKHTEGMFLSVKKCSGIS
jgi:hypothetical protein